MTRASWGEDLVVSLKTGRIRGDYVTVKGSDRRVKLFLAVPFAQPPVGTLRLAAPRDVEPWEGERDATRQPNMCIQDPELVVSVSRTMSMSYSPPEVSEDCLYLNVYTPADAAAGAKLPVLVWIHGGGLSMGAASQYDGSPMAAYENVVIVVIQYRLGILGFLSTGDEHAQGNWGFLDQLAALRWVQGNIEAFGGDPQSVTVAGESAGGISASILTLSPLAAGLFHRAIFQSGVATLGTYTTPVLDVVFSLTGCEGGSTQDKVLCLKTKSQDELVTATKKVKDLDSSFVLGVQMKIFLGAVVDQQFLMDTAEELLQRKEVLKVPVMLGITNHEFGWILPQVLPSLHSCSPTSEQSLNNGHIAASLLAELSGVPAANGLIADEYLKDATTPEQVRDGFTEIMGDLLMTLPVVKVAGYHSDAGIDVYLYEFVYEAAIHKASRPDFVKADHADDVGFVFGGCFWNGEIKIIGVCRTMMAYWANFARSGKHIALCVEFPFPRKKLKPKADPRFWVFTPSLCQRAKRFWNFLK
uniref:Carboxylic ester hydrolase n=1 Tax=Salarias fasciatus TaxID=181472 RepID=A0A672FFP6_SALFA